MMGTLLWTVLLWSAVTLGAYAAALVVFRRCGGSSLAHPLIVTVLLVSLLLFLTDTPIVQYQQATAWLDALLGPATVALAIPMYSCLGVIRQAGYRLLVPILIGGAFAPLTAVVMLWLFSSGSADEPLLMTMTTKSITTPLAMETSALIGGLAELAAGLVILTGIIGAVCASWVFRAARIDSDVARGLALGTAAHAVGTARALEFNERCGALATLALCVNGILTSVFLSLWFWFF